MTLIHTYRPLESPASYCDFMLGIKDNSLLEPIKARGYFLNLQSVHLLHETVGLSAQSLRKSWHENENFCQSDKSGQPPLAAYPIYLITVGDAEKERVVYIGKTSSNSSRFSSGHSAISKLHHPKYDGLSKRLYLCCVVFLSKTLGSIPIEWVKPLGFAESLLNSFEANLIYWEQPELNKQHKSKEPIFEYGQVHVQNLTSGATDFWDDHFI